MPPVRLQVHWPGLVSVQEGAGGSGSSASGSNSVLMPSPDGSSSAAAVMPDAVEAGAASRRLEVSLFAVDADCTRVHALTAPPASARSSAGIGLQVVSAVKEVLCVGVSSAPSAAGVAVSVTAVTAGVAWLM